MPKIAANKFAATCALREGAKCPGHVAARAGVYLKGKVLCVSCVARVRRDKYQDGPYCPSAFAGIPTRLILWAARQNGIAKEAWDAHRHS